MIFRAFLGEPVAEARELEDGHLHHAEVHRNPATGEEEDTGVGFPGAEHHIAEREGPMKGAMGVLALGAIAAGFLQVPHVTKVIDHFLAPTFADSKLYERDPSGGLEAFGLILGAVVGLAGIALAYHLWVRSPETPARIRSRLSGLHGFLVNKWYFDELYDRGVVAPMRAAGSFAAGAFERVFVDRTLIGGATGAVALGSRIVRGLQAGYLRAYAGLLLAGVVVVSGYFLLNS
jgi:NADH-quinone oxidoreductase subunit L